MLRDDIAKLLVMDALSNSDATKTANDVADSIIKLPSGLVAKKYCNQCNHGLDECPIPEELDRCDIEHTITRPIPIIEAVEILKSIAIKRATGFYGKDGMPFYEISGERIEVKVIEGEHIK